MYTQSHHGASIASLIKHLRRAVSARLMRRFRPTVPHRVGMKAYRQRSSWGLNPSVCPCDLHFTEYLEKKDLAAKAFFHFGTGSHHHVGLWCHRKERNQVLGITASKLEHEAYVKLVLNNPGIAKSYKVLFVDIYTLTAEMLPTFDVVSMFHLCEFTPSRRPENEGVVLHDDKTILQLLTDKLNPGGCIVFYTGSFGWREAKPLVDDLVDGGRLALKEEYKSLLAFGKIS